MAAPPPPPEEEQQYFLSVTEARQQFERLAADQASRNGSLPPSSSATSSRLATKPLPPRPLTTDIDAPLRSNGTSLPRRAGSPDDSGGGAAGPGSPVSLQPPTTLLPTSLSLASSVSGEHPAAAVFVHGDGDDPTSIGGLSHPQLADAAQRAVDINPGAAAAAATAPDGKQNGAGAEMPSSSLGRPKSWPLHTLFGHPADLNELADEIPPPPPPIPQHPNRERVPSSHSRSSLATSVCSSSSSAQRSQSSSAVSGTSSDSLNSSNNGVPGGDHPLEFPPNPPLPPQGGGARRRSHSYQPGAGMSSSMPVLSDVHGRKPSIGSSPTTNSPGGNVPLTRLDAHGMPTDHYIVGNCIGRGNFGAVFRAIHLESLKTVAIKRVPVPDTEQLTTMMREVRKMESLHHENVVRYHGFIRTASEFNLILEYVENGSLASTLKHFGPLPEVVVLDIVYQVLQGLNYLHERELKHLDIKAANLLYTKDGQVKLSDFGVSQSAMDTHSDKFVGTAYWMAPEVIALDGPCTASDIWSLGCTIIELLTGVPPYFDMIPMSALYKIVEDDAPPLPEDISPDLHHFMLCCFQKNPAHRWSAHALLAHDWIWKRTSNQYGSSARPPPPAIVTTGSSVAPPVIIPSDSDPTAAMSAGALIRPPSSHDLSPTPTNSAGYGPPVDLRRETSRPGSPMPSPRSRLPAPPEIKRPAPPPPVSVYSPSVDSAVARSPGLPPTGLHANSAGDPMASWSSAHHGASALGQANASSAPIVAPTPRVPQGGASVSMMIPGSFPPADVSAAPPIRNTGDNSWPQRQQQYVPHRAPPPVPPVQPRFDAEAPSSSDSSPSSGGMVEMVRGMIRRASRSRSRSLSRRGSAEGSRSDPPTPPSEAHASDDQMTMRTAHDGSHGGGGFDQPSADDALPPLPVVPAALGARLAHSWIKAQYAAPGIPCKQCAAVMRKGRVCHLCAVPVCKACSLGEGTSGASAAAMVCNVSSIRYSMSIGSMARRSSGIATAAGTGAAVAGSSAIRSPSAQRRSRTPLANMVGVETGSLARSPTPPESSSPRLRARLQGSRHLSNSAPLLLRGIPQAASTGNASLIPAASSKKDVSGPPDCDMLFGQQEQKQKRRKRGSFAASRGAPAPIEYRAKARQDCKVM